MNEKKVASEKILITGIAGSGGSFLAEYILDNHPTSRLYGISRWHSVSSNRNLSNVIDSVGMHECDLCDLSSVFTVLRQVKPDKIFHIASHANVRASFHTPLTVMQNNINGTANLLEAVRLLGIDPIIQICSTSEVYGQVDPKRVPIAEDCLFQPSSPYAVSKTTQDLLGFTYFQAYNMRVVRTRMFSYLNPRRYDLFATSFALQVARIELGQQKFLNHGNLDSVRTIIDVRDAMEAYWLTATRGKIREIYNIGGDKIISVKNFLKDNPDKLK